MGSKFDISAFASTFAPVSDSDTPPSGEFQELPEEEKGELPF